LIASCLYRYHNVYFPSQQKEDTALERAGDEAQRHAKPAQLILVKGHDWDSEIPFYSHRHAIMDRGFSADQIQRQILVAVPAVVGDVLYCFDARKEFEGLDLNGRIARVHQDYGLLVTSASDDGVCEHYFRADAVRSSASLPVIGVIDMPRDNEAVTGTIVVAGWALSGQPIKEIGIAIDGQYVTSTRLVNSRPDLIGPYQQYPGHPFNGYRTTADISRLTRGLHSVSASAVLQDGSRHSAGHKTFVIP
jgi:hypothetical protein